METEGFESSTTGVIIGAAAFAVGLGVLGIIIKNKLNQIEQNSGAVIPDKINNRAQAAQASLEYDPRQRGGKRRTRRSRPRRGTRRV